MPRLDNNSEEILNRSIENGIDLQSLIGKVAKHYINRVMAETNENKSRAAELLGFNNPQTLKNWMTKYDVK